MVRRLVTIASLAAVVARSSQGQSSSFADRNPRAAAVRLPAPARIVLDGRIDEAAWGSAQVIGDFFQHEPRSGALASERTEVRLLYDSTTLFVGVDARDSEPEAVIARILQRDRLMQLNVEGKLILTGDDAVAILLAPMSDKRNAVVLATNPNGAEYDAQITDEGREVNVAWRAIWRVRAARTETGWSAEFAIPFRSLRLANGAQRRWGLNVYRVIRRKNEHVMWRAWSRDNAGFLKVSQAGEIEIPGNGADSDLGLDVKVSGVGRNRGDESGRAILADGAADAKYQLGGIVLDATANTDFAQADADEVQVNLTRFDLFLPEKRDFFLENAGIFEFGTRSHSGPPPYLMFFSRRIGISDSGEVPVLGGARATGRIGRQTVGMLHMRTRAAFHEPASSYSVSRLKRDVGKTGYVGAMITDIRRRGGSASSVGGADLSLWPTRTTNVQAFVASTDLHGPISVAEVASRLAIDRQVDRFGIALSRLTVGADAYPELGFAQRTDLGHNEVFGRLTTRPRIRGLRRLDWFGLAQYVTRTDGAFQDRSIGPAATFVWDSGDGFTLYRLDARTQVDAAFHVAGRLPVAPGRFDNSETGVILSAGRHRALSGNVALSRKAFYGGDLSAATGSLAVAFESRGMVEGTRAFREVQLPSGTFISNVTTLRGAYTLSTRAAVTSQVQYSALERRRWANARFSYEYQPGSEVFVVLNREDGHGIVRHTTWGLVKVTYLMRM